MSIISGSSGAWARRLLFTYNSYPARVVAIKRKLPAPEIAEAIEELARLPPLRTLLCPQPFPRTLSDVRRVRAPEFTNHSAEVQFNVGIFRHYATELTRLLTIQAAVQRALLVGSYSEARQLLDDATAEFGTSVWLVGSRLLLEQLDQGIQGHKSYLRSQIRSGVNSATAFVVTQKSLAIDPNNTFDYLHSTLKKALSQPKIGAPARKYYWQFIMPTEGDFSGSPFDILATFESEALIDRYLCFQREVVAATLSRGVEKSSPIHEAIDRLADAIADPILRNCATLIRGSLIGPLQLDAAYQKIIDDYTTGNYSSSAHAARELLVQDPTKTELYEIFVRSCLRGGQRAYLNQFAAPMRHALKSMAAVLTLSPAYNTGENYLLKAALAFPHTPLSDAWLAFLDRHKRPNLGGNFSPHEARYAVSGKIEDPRNIEVLSAVLGNANGIFGNNGARFTPFVTASVFMHINSAAADSGTEWAIPSLPEYRKKQFLGDLALRCADFRGALAYFREARATAKGFGRYTSFRNEVECLLRLGQFNELIKNLVTAYLDNDFIHKIIDLKKVIDGVPESAIKDPAVAVVRPVFEYIRWRHVSPVKWTPVSVSLRRLIGTLGITAPHRLTLDHIPDRALLLFILRNVAVTRSFEDLKGFKTPASAAEERVRVLHALKVLDPHSSSVYEREIRTLSRNMVINKHRQNFEASIFDFDVSPLQELLEKSLQSPYAHYRAIQSDPELARTEGHIAHALGKTTKDPTINAMSASAAAPSSTLSGLVHEIAEAFALDPACGLEVQLASNIRHGRLLRHLRSAVDRHHLVTRKDAAGEYAENSFWKNRTQNADWPKVNAALKQFSRDFDAAVETLIDRRILVNKGDDAAALFDPYFSDAENAAAESRIPLGAELPDIISITLGYLWEWLDAQLIKVRLYLSRSAQKELMDLLSKFEGKLRKTTSEEDNHELFSAIALAKTDLVTAVASATSWFKRSKVDQPGVFDLAIVLEVVDQTIRNFFPNLEFKLAAQDVQTQSMEWRGELMSKFCRIFEMLFINCIEHSGNQERCPEIELKIYQDDRYLSILVRNKLFDECDAEAVRRGLARAEAEYKRDGLMQRAAEAKGSGIAKIARLIAVDLKASSELRAGVTTERWAEVELRLETAAFETPATAAAA